MPEQDPDEPIDPEWTEPAEYVQAGEERDYEANYYGWIEEIGGGTVGGAVGAVVWEPGQTPAPPSPAPPPPVGPPPVPPVGNPPPVKKPRPKVPPIG